MSFIKSIIEDAALEWFGAHWSDMPENFKKTLGLKSGLVRV